MKKRILSLLLALALLCAMLPQIALPARAADDDSGTCGDNLTWTFDADTGTLTVAGSGEMYDFDDYSPWYSYRSQILHVVLPAGLTEIGDWAFYGCTGLTQITLPAGLTEIGTGAFYDCTGLTQLTLPAGLTEIGIWAFSGCTGLTVFSVASDNPNFSSNAGVVFNKEGTKLVLYPCGRTGAYTVPAGVTFIGSYAFYDCTGLTQLTLPAALTEIGYKAFEGCTGLTQLTLPAALTEIGYKAFEGCTGLTQLTLPAGLTYIGEDAFYGCTGLTQITFPAGLTEIDYAAFSGCTGLTQITFPAGLTEIDYGAFSGCTGLTSFSVSEDNPYFSTDAIGILFNKEKTELILYPFGRSGSYTVPNSVTSIGNYAFDDCDGLTSVTFPDGLTSIGDVAFSGCTGLTSVTFPDGLTSIGDAAFRDCTGLTSVTFPDGLTSIGDAAFRDCTGLTSVLIPESVVEIGDVSFGFYWDEASDAYKPVENFTIYGYKDTAAQTYANENGIKFIPLDPASGFADVKPKHYYYNAMLWALEHGITSGTSRVTFSPNDTCTRGQVMTFLYAAKGKPEADWSNNPFVDVKKSKYYFKPVLWAFQNGITNGVDDTHFQPNGGCTRAQVVTFLWALSGKPNPKAGSNPFKDVKKSNWYYKAVLWAYQNGITSGVDATHFGPNQTCTRGQVVTFLYALLGDK